MGGKQAMQKHRAGSSPIFRKARVSLVILSVLLLLSQIFFHGLVGDASRLASYANYMPETLRGPTSATVNEGTARSMFRSISGNNNNATTMAEFQTRDEQAVTHSYNKSKAKYAYAFVIGGCKPEKPSYRFFIHNILITARILRETRSNSRADADFDIVVLFQMGYESAHERLPIEDVRQLKAMDVKIKYIPKSPQESFYRTVLDKFRILGLVEYRRVLFMDGDVIPTTNLDFLFELSDGPDAILKENLVVAGKLEPANAGFFMVAPKKGDLEQINRIIQKREEEARTLEYPYFDPVVGWGHVIDPKDPWWTITQMQGTNWTFWSAFADQGLLYYWARYVKKDVSILHRDWVINWGAGPRAEEKLINPFRNMTSKTSCWPSERSASADTCTIYSELFYHFTGGKKKPWILGPPIDFLDADKKWQSPLNFWFYHLGQLNDDLGMGLHFHNWTAGKRKHRRQSLGTSSMFYTIRNASTNLLEEMTE